MGQADNFWWAWIFTRIYMWIKGEPFWVEEKEETSRCGACNQFLLAENIMKPTEEGWIVKCKCGQLNSVIK